MMNRLFSFCLSMVCADFAPLVVSAQNVDMFTYSHLEAEDGLCCQRVYSVCQMGDGALWWSTKKDVERYNGMTTRHYQPPCGSGFSTFAGRTIKLHVSRADSLLYAFDNQGNISYYDEVQDRFQLKTSVSSLIDGEILLNDILVTENGIWLAMREGTFFLAGQTLVPVMKHLFTNTIVRVDDLILLCAKEGVWEYHIEPDGSPHNGMSPMKLLNQNVESAYYDTLYHKVWLGGFLGGFQIASPQADGMLHIEETVGDTFMNPVRSFCPYDNQTMLVGIDGMGVFRVERRPDDSFNREPALLFDANDGKAGVLHGNGIYAVIRDAWDNIVVGSYSGGIDIARPVGSTPAIFQHIRDNRQSLLNDHVNCVAQFPDGTLVMGTDNGISLLRADTHQWTHTCLGTVVLSLCLTPQATMLASTYGNGVYEISAQGACRQLYSAQGGVLHDDHVYKLYFDREGSLWMGCLDGELVQRKVGEPLCHYYMIKNVQDIVQLPDGLLAVATADGIKLVSAETREVTELDYSKGLTDVNRYVTSLFLNGSKELWIGTDGGGVYVYDLHKHQASQITNADGLPSNMISSMVKDYKGRILISTDAGIAFIDGMEGGKQVACINYCYGIEREFSARAVVCMNNRHILYGTSTGALIINPDNIQQLNYSAKLHLLGVNCTEDDSDLFNQRVHSMLEEGILRLHYSQRTFDLSFESINLRNQFDIVYQYQVSDGEWSQPTREQTIRFTNMEPGTHLLRLRCVSRTCDIVLDELKLTIVVYQPWWNSWWMWVVYVGLVVLAFYGAWRFYELHTKYMHLVLSDPNLNLEREDQVTGYESEPSGEQPSDNAVVDTDNAEGAEFISRVTKLVLAHLSDADFTIDRLCREMAMSRTLFYIKLKTYTGNSPQDFIRIIRLERAAALLRSGRSVTESAVLTGFDNPKYFSTVFKKYFGMSPSKYC
ncbi:MAG: helix-turn-helix domain-containing protein [Prevotella sp.]|nr:helix-turn-helix domain-containing protein [Prevotella sp.]